MSPMRDGEKDGSDYHFVTGERFMELVKEGAFTEYRSYKTNYHGVEDTWYYGSPLVDPTKNHVVVLDPDGVKSYIRTYGAKNLQIHYVRANDEVRTKRAMKRGGFDMSEWTWRLKADEEAFSDDVINDIAGKASVTVIDNE